VVFVSIDTSDPTWGPVYVGDINSHMASHVAHIADWADTLTPTDYAQPDDPHPNSAGNAQLAQVIQQAVQGCPNVAGTTTTTVDDSSSGTTDTSVDDTTTTSEDTTTTSDDTTTSTDDTTTTTDDTTTGTDDTTTSTDDTDTSVSG
jgi:hypothetical protein